MIEIIMISIIMSLTIKIRMIASERVIIIVIKCVSFSCLGYKNSCFYIDRLCSEFDICFIGEHWVRLDELNTVR